METTCPHCAQGIEIAPEILESLQGSPAFECPACAGAVPVPELVELVPTARVARPWPVAPSVGKRKAADPPVIKKRQQSLKPKEGTVENDPAASRRGLSRNLWILGAMALLTLGGLAAFIGSWQGESIFRIKKDVLNETIHNKFFSDLIASGATTLRKLKASVDRLQPFGIGFVGVSKETFTAAQAQILAKSLGGEVLTIDDSAPAAENALLESITTNFPDLAGSTTWVMNGGEPKVLDSPTVSGVTTLDRPRKVFLGWFPKSPAKGPDGHSVAIQSTAPLVPRIMQAREWVNVTVDYSYTGTGSVYMWATPMFKSKQLAASMASGSDSPVPEQGKIKSRLTFIGLAEIDEISLKMVDAKSRATLAFALLPYRAVWPLDPQQWSLELITIGEPAVLTHAKEISLPVTPRKTLQRHLTAKYKIPETTKLASNLLAKEAGILPPEFVAELSANHGTAWHFDAESRSGYRGVNREGKSPLISRVMLPRKVEPIGSI